MGLYFRALGNQNIKNLIHFKFLGRDHIHRRQESSCFQFMYYLVAS